MAEYFCIGPWIPPFSHIQFLLGGPKENNIHGAQSCGDIGTGFEDDINVRTTWRMPRIWVGIPHGIEGAAKHTNKQWEERPWIQRRLKSGFSLDSWMTWSKVDLTWCLIASGIAKHLHLQKSSVCVSTKMSPQLQTTESVPSRSTSPVMLSKRDLKTMHQSNSTVGG